MMYTTKIRKKFLAFIKYLKMTVLAVNFSPLWNVYKIKSAKIIALLRYNLLKSHGCR